MVRLAWFPAIRKERARGRQVGGLGCKLTMLEAVALFFAVAGQVTRSAVMIYTDNSGFYRAYRKDTSRDLFTYTVTKAIRTVAAHLDVNLRVIWTPRCSGTGEAIADNLSKHKVAEALALAGPEAEQSFAKIPEALVRWLDNPSLSRVLGHAELEELAESMPVLPWDQEDEESLVKLRACKKRSFGAVY